ncbi:MAG: PaaI family thioesterase [Candidatus Odyssella sp.]|nr:PaaI family thioesterase [Candidatus Odyssella sp.]
MPHSADDTRTRRYGWRDPRPGAAAAQRMSGLDYMTAMMKGEIAAGPIMDTLAFRLAAVGDGFAAFECEPKEFAYNALGSVHGGLPATLIDSAASCAVHTKLPAGTGYTTVNLAVDMIKPITEAAGTLRCEGRVVRAGNRIAVADAELKGADGTLYARGSATCLILPPPKRPG